MSFENLKRTSGNFSTLREKMKNDSTGGAKSYKDDRFWKLTVDKSGNGYAVIRFLPAMEGEELPYVLRYEHAFQDKNTGKWFIDNCPTTIGQECACCMANSELWNTGTEANQNIVRGRKRGKKYYANILVVSDSAHPENNGKVFLYQFGPKIFQKILDKIDPQFPDEKPCEVFDFWEGANFRLKAHSQSGQRSYDKSDFDSPSTLAEDDRLKEIYGELHSLQSLVAPSEFKTVTEMQGRLNMVLGVSAGKSDTSYETAPSHTPPARPMVEELTNDVPFNHSPAAASDSLDEYEALLR